LPFALDSDDGQSYYRYASLLYADPLALPAVLGANEGFPPLYSIFLAVIFGASRGSLAVVIVAQAVLASVSALLLFRLGRDAVSVPVGLAAAALFATDKNIVQNQATLTAEAILVPLILFALYSLFRYRSTQKFGWLAGCALSVAAIFVTRNLLISVLPVAMLWLWLVGQRRFFIRDSATLLATAVLVALPIGIVTLQTEGRMRFTNQLAGLGYEYVGKGDMTIENQFLLDRGINPFADPVGSVGRVVSDPLPVLGFFAIAVPQRLSYLLFSSSPGASDPLLVINPGLFPNSYGDLVEIVFAVATLIAPVVVLRRRLYRRPEIMLLCLYLFVYLTLFAFVFPPRQAFRYRIPIEPVVFLAQAAVLTIAVRWGTASQPPRA
jgi:4-amino-4-deoxy-L-arabinose transferase-like glycosyltransferase